MGTDHLAEAKRLVAQPMFSLEIAIAHALISIAESLAELNARDDEALNGPRD